jgi:hypothetical protein
MGVYIDHPSMPKEQWLAWNAIPCTMKEAKEHEDYQDVLLVTLLDNFYFTAACVIYRPEEKAEIIHDRRVRAFFLVERGKLPEDVRKVLDVYQRREQGA